MSPTSYQTAPPRDNIKLKYMVTRTGFEPVLPPWKGGVLTAWPTGHCYNELIFPCKFFKWRRARDLNPRDSITAHTSSSRAPSATRTALHNGSTGRIRTYDRSVNSRLLYHWATVEWIKCLATSYSRRENPTTIGAEELNFCVRYGNRCDLFAIVTKSSGWSKVLNLQGQDILYSFFNKNASVFKQNHLTLSIIMSEVYTLKTR